MARWTPDPTFYPSPTLATQAPPEKLAYVALINPQKNGPDAIGSATHTVTPTGGTVPRCPTTAR